MAEAGYIAVYDNEEVNFYNKTARIQISEEAVLKGYKCKQTKLWRVPLQDTIQDEHADILILDSPCGMHSLNTLYEVEQTTATTNYSTSFANPSATYMTYQAHSKQFATSMRLQVSQPNQLG